MKYSEHYKRSTPVSEIDKKFIAWIDNVEDIILLQTGFWLLDLADQPYMLRFEEGVSAEMMADEVYSELFDI
jgi:hypothetical protein